MINVGLENNLKCAESSTYINTSWNFKKQIQNNNKNNTQKIDEVKASCNKLKILLLF